MGVAVSCRRQLLQQLGAPHIVRCHLREDALVGDLGGGRRWPGLGGGRLRSACSLVLQEQDELIVGECVHK